MSFRRQRSFLCIALLAIAGCVEPYYPDLKDEDSGLLVVEGIVNTNSHSVNVKLSIASAIYGPAKLLPEGEATVLLENKSGETVQLLNNGDGTYSVSSAAINSSGEYRLHIKRSGDREYFSDYVESNVVKSVIDEVRYEIIDNKIHIYVDAHDPTMTARYFLWEIEEVWEYNSSFPSYFKKVGNNIVRRAPEDGIGICWNKAASPKVLIFNSSKLSTSEVKDFELAVIAGQSQKLSRRYSINVRQRVLSDDAYRYWMQIKETSENIGGLFDPQLSSVTGNLISNTGVPVLGNFESGDVVERRMFIDHDELPEFFGDLSERPLCSFTGDAVLIPGSSLGIVTEATLLIEYDSPSGGYYTADPICIDCRVQGGTTRKPPFW